MLRVLSPSRVGCYIGSVFVDALAYADDIVIIAPSACAMRKLLNICDNYAKSKYIAFFAKNRSYLRAYLIDDLFCIWNNPIDFV